jgi:hypothetical protein
VDKAVNVYAMLNFERSGNGTLWVSHECSERPGDGGREAEVYYVHQADEWQLTVYDGDHDVSVRVYRCPWCGLNLRDFDAARYAEEASAE